MKFKIQHNFDVSLEKLLEAREYRYSNLDKFPDLKNLELISETKKENSVFQKRKIHLGKSVPKVLQPFMKDLSLVEESEFDTKNHIHKFKITPIINQSSFTIRGESCYISVDENHSSRNYDIEVKSSVLFLSSAIESIISDIYKQNLEKDKLTILKYLKSMKNT